MSVPLSNKAGSTARLCVRRDSPAGLHRRAPMLTAQVILPTSSTVLRSWRIQPLTEIVVCECPQTRPCRHRRRSGGGDRGWDDLVRH